MSVVSESGIRLDSFCYQALTYMLSPTTCAQLQEFLCAAIFMRAALPQYMKLTAMLSDLLEKFYAAIGKQTKRVVKKFLLKEVEWNELHDSEFENLKKGLHETLTLSHPDSKEGICFV